MNQVSDNDRCQSSPSQTQPVRQYAVQRWKSGQVSEEDDWVSEEVPVALIYNQIPYAVMLASPIQLDEFALGFSVTEGIVENASELQRIEIAEVAQGVEINMRIPGDRLSRVLQRERNLTGRTGCGICGINDLDDIAERPVMKVNNGFKVRHDTIAGLADSLREYQSLNRKTGSLHGAAWVSQNCEILHVCEDVGRHNALDKLIGWLLASGQDLDSGLIMVSSRASYEMVQKTVSIGVSCLIALSAPTGMAIQLAEATGLALVGFAAKKHHVVYTHPERFQASD